MLIPRRVGNGKKEGQNKKTAGLAVLLGTAATFARSVQDQALPKIGQK